MNVHEQIVKLLPAFALDELSGPQASQVQAHLAKCEDCRAELDRLRRLLAHTQRVWTANAGEDAAQAAAERLLSSLQAQSPNGSGNRAILSPSNLWNRLKESRIMQRRSRRLTAAAALISLAAALYLLWGLVAGVNTVYAIEQTVQALRDARAVVMSGTINVGLGMPVAIWATPDPLGVETEDLKLVLGEGFERSELVIHDGTSRYYRGGNANVVCVSPGKRITLNPWPGSRFFEELAGGTDRDVSITYGTDPQTQQGIVYLACRFPRLDVSCQIQCNLETKLPVRIKGWYNLDFEGHPAFELNKIVYTESLPADLFSMSNLPRGAEVHPDLQMNWGPDQGLDVEGVSQDEACRLIAGEYMQALVQGDAAKLRRLYPTLHEREILPTDRGDSRPSQVIEVGQPYKTFGYNYGFIVPGKIRYPQGQVYELQLVVHTRRVDGKVSCAIVDQYDLPQPVWAADQGLDMAGLERKEACRRIVSEYMQALVNGDWAKAHSLYPGVPAAGIAHAIGDNPPSRILEIGQVVDPFGDRGPCTSSPSLRVKLQRLGGETEDCMVDIHIRQANGRRSCAIVGVSGLSGTGTRVTDPQ